MSRVDRTIAQHLAASAFERALSAALDAGLTLEGLHDALGRREMDERRSRHREALDRAHNPAAEPSGPDCGCSTAYPARLCAHPKPPYRQEAQ